MENEALAAGVWAQGIGERVGVRETLVSIFVLCRCFWAAPASG